MSGDEDWSEQPVHFTGCTCGHEPEDHTWGSCTIILPSGDECPCGGGWEE